jgi:hypothetical protein
MSNNYSSILIKASLPFFNYFIASILVLINSFNKVIFFSSGNFETSAQIVGSTLVLISSVSLRK